MAQQKNTVVFGVNPGKSHAKFRDKYKFPFPLLFDQGQKVGAAYRAKGLIVPKRTVYLIGPDGVIRYARTRKAGAGRSAGGGRMSRMTLPRFYPILDTETAARRGAGVVDAATRILEGGAAILQFRHKGFWSREIFEQLEHIAEMCHACGVPLIVNDRADMARLVEAGLHLGQDDLPPSAARRILGNARARVFHA